MNLAAQLRARRARKRTQRAADRSINFAATATVRQELLAAAESRPRRGQPRRVI
ncbi:hypothetical protein SAMN06265360_10142 [Haloechinothrix alba]|uniref:Uncharacterized protein n=1 Tax=Haloechinothrix alba TaxID=664784 RepID=A0A238UYK5_9PSEU|nr:hypothetical protein [Haloechinothrix alba]SNR27255.1 hypothetical protein SAMN06265360_10142 [Haloechinothrix alba]